MKKKLLASVLSLMLAAACFTSCGDSESSDKKSSAKDSTAGGTSLSADESGRSAEDSDTSSDKDSSETESKAEDKKEKGKHLSKIETFDDSNALIYLQEYAYSTDAATGNIECVITQTGKKIAGSPITAQSPKTAVKYVYDSDFHILGYYSGSPLIQRDEYVYENGVQIKRIEYDNKGEVNLTAVFERDSNGTVTNETQYNRKNEIYKTIKYENGKAKLETVKGTGYTVAYKYDANGNMTEKNFYDPKGTLEETITVTYDEKGNKTHYKDYHIPNATVNVEYDYENSYTDSGYTQTEYMLLGGNRNLKSKTAYDTEGFKIEVLEYLNGKIVQTTKYTYTEL